VRRLGGYLLTATALIACPCHLLLLLPLALEVWPKSPELTV